MPDLQLVSALIADIYDAALDPSLWPLVLQKLVHVFRGVAAVLYVQDVQLRTGQFYFSYGDNPDYTRSYFEKYVRMSPLLPHFMMKEVGDVFRTSELMPYEELRGSRFFKEWVEPQGYTDFVAVTLDKSATSVANLSVGRDVSQGFMDEESVELMKLLAPHLRRSVMIGKIIDLHKLEADNFSNVLNGLSDAVLLVDGNGAIAFANESARQMMAEAAVMECGADNIVRFFDTKADLILRAVFAATRGGDAEVQTNGVAVPISAQSGHRYLAHVLTLTSGARRHAGFPGGGSAAVFVRKAAIDLPSPIEIVAKLYQLTPSELRVLYGLMETGGIPGISAMLGISEATVKTHIQHLFEKTGVRRQADLVKLVAGHASPIRN